MAGIASRMSDILILTSDNPRNEEPESILGEMRQGVPEEHSRNMAVITDRKEAIRAACAMATPGDFILVAGKGHETYQEIRGVRTPFDDMSVLREAFGMNNS
jgi:UDP-N-acetylmuramoyl-L-alanyl-D-glutamate--2,6-diaminopimelate ligase